jgi:uncharacterized protein
METRTLKLSFREKAKQFLTSPFFIIETVVVSSFLMAWLGGLGFIVGLVIALLTFWATRWDLEYFGLGKAKWTLSIVPAIGYTMIIILLNDFLIEPLTEILTNEPVDLSNFEGRRGNLQNLLIMLAIMWVMAAFGEEFFYRGYVMKRLAILFGNNNSSWILAVFISSILFGLTHGYQGISGMITTGIVGLILALAFYRNRSNLAVGILTHGIYDTYGILLIYFEKELVLKNIMIEIYQTIIN